MAMTKTNGDVSGAAQLGMPQPGRTALEILTEATALHADHYRNVVADFPSEIRHIAGYHIGWWDLEGFARRDTGKSLRPALVFACHRALHSDDVKASAAELAAATAVELVHDFSLLHDDIMDQSRMRRHRAAAWVNFGASKAMLTGDMMLASAFTTLASVEAPYAEGMTNSLSRSVYQLCVGQALDMAFEAQSAVSIDHALQMVRGKTAALMACACELGAIAAGATPEASAQMCTFGLHVGTAFQLVDDLLGIWGDSPVTGKPVGADLTARKKSVPVAAAMTTDSTAARRLTQAYASTDALDGEDAIVLANLVEEAGGRTWTEQRVVRELTQAQRCLDAMVAGTDQTSDLHSLVAFLTDRSA